MDRKTIKLYNEFCEASKNSNHKKLLSLFIQLNIEDVSMENPAYLIQMARTTFITIKFHYKAATPKEIGHIVTQFEKLLGFIAKQNDFEKFISTLNMFTSTKHLEACKSLLIDAASEIDMNVWIQSIINHIALMNGKNIKTVGVAKDLILSLTRSLLIFASLETELCKNVPTFQYTKYFIDECMKLNIIHNNKQFCSQYLKSFNLIKTFLNTFEFESIEWIKAINELTQNLQSSVQTLRSTLVQDLHVTISKLIYITEKQLIARNSSDEIMAFIGLTNHLISILHNVKYEKTFCSECPSSVGVHQIEEILTVAMKLFQTSIEKKTANEKIGNEFGKFYCMKLKNLSTMCCSKNGRYQTNALVLLKSILTNIENDQIPFIIPIFIYTFRSISNIKLTNTTVEFNELYLLRKYFDILKNGQYHEDLIKIVYLTIAYSIAANESNRNYLHHMIYAICKIQKEQMPIDKYRSPYNYFNDKRENYFHLKLPNNLDMIETMLTYIRIGAKYITFSKEMETIIIDDMMKMSKTQNIIRCSRFILFFTLKNYEQYEESLVKPLERELKLKINDNISNTVIVGAIAWSKYLFEKEKVSQKYKDIKISTKLDIVMPALDELNLQYERINYQLLKQAKNAYIAFENHYIKCDQTKRSYYDDEVKCVLQNFRSTAKYLTISGYQTDAIDLYLKSYEFSKIMNDNFARITCCTYFAEHSNAIEQFGTKNNLNIDEEIDQCHEIIINELKSIDTLSTRKEIEILMCLLSIAIYYINNDQNDKSHTMMIYVKQKIDQRISNGKTHLTLVKMKYYFILFKMITKYNLPCQLTASNYLNLIIEHIKAKIFIFADDVLLKPTILYESIFGFVEFSLNRFNNLSRLLPMLATVIKYFIRIGCVRIISKAILYTARCHIFMEDSKAGQNALSNLEKIFIFNTSSASTNLKLPEINASDSEMTDVTVRDSASAPVKCISPFKVFVNGIEAEMVTILQDHLKNCSCEICYFDETRWMAFESASINGKMLINKKSETSAYLFYKTAYNYWNKHLKLLTKNQFVLSSVAYFFMWYAQYQWKHRNNVLQAKKLMQEALHQLHEIPNYDLVLEKDILYQLKIFELNQSQNHQRKKLEFINNVKCIDSKHKLSDDDYSATIRRRKKIDMNELMFDIFSDDNDSLQSSTASSTATKRKNDVTKKKDLKKPNIKILIDDDSIFPVDSSPETNVNAKCTPSKSKLRKAKVKSATKSESKKPIIDENAIISINSSPEMITNDINPPGNQNGRSLRPRRGTAIKKY